jgi:hypothetical protein
VVIQLNVVELLFVTGNATPAPGKKNIASPAPKHILWLYCASIKKA